MSIFPSETFARPVVLGSTSRYRRELLERLRLPFLVCAGLALLNWLYGFFVLPESLPREKRETKLNWKKANSLTETYTIAFLLDQLAGKSAYTAYLTPEYASTEPSVEFSVKTASK